MPSTEPQPQPLPAGSERSLDDLLVEIAQCKISVDSVKVTPVRWLPPPFRRRYGKYHLYRGFQYYQDGFNDVYYILDEHVEWRTKPIMQELLLRGQEVLAHFIEIRSQSKLTKEQCRLWKHRARRFKFRAEASSHVARITKLLNLVEPLSDPDAPSGTSTPQRPGTPVAAAATYNRYFIEALTPSEEPPITAGSIYAHDDSDIFTRLSSMDRISDTELEVTEGSPATSTTRLIVLNRVSTTTTDDGSEVTDVAQAFAIQRGDVPLRTLRRCSSNPCI
ncbi:hypothetical protein C8Q74DRAFT_1259375 [Fomes fomentarius]|nr:hypothetical protein C8Q74DRAFT_1259375 [Fomes fomentarius]